ncbi:uncharacterized protein LOC133188843 [Saccostrea echinata]|uniref:uncharacterized protein LOC133188843 n=1 Tax=Saccostrea echinata TaxID=191078 RepID=UPI002A82D4E6|nr:uncharacterized protein LOC133188843 [Saccostrea echinata]
MSIKALFCLGLVICGMKMANGNLGDFQKVLKKAENIANAFGMSGSGEVDRGKGCIISWNFKGQLMGFEYKYLGVCVDRCTGETTTSITQSKGGAIEHCLSDLFQKLSAKHEL